MTTREAGRLDGWLVATAETPQRMTYPRHGADGVALGRVSCVFTAHHYDNGAFTYRFDIDGEGKITSDRQE